MIDTLKIYTQDFAIKDGARIAVQPGIVQYETGDQREVPLFKDESGRDVFGSKAYLNNDKYNLTIQPMGSGVDLFLQTSLPKLVKDDNYSPLSVSETKQAIAEIGKDLRSCGVSLNLDNCELSRVDLFKNIVGDNDFMSYSPLFALLRSKRQVKRDYGTTFTWSNTQREICVYDKIAEMTAKGAKKNPVVGYPENTMRFEYRLKNSRVCKREIGSGTVRELVNNLDDLPKRYKDALSKSIFSLNLDEVNIIASQELQSWMQSYATLYGETWLSRLLRDYGAYQLSRLAGDEVVKIVMACVIGGDRYKLFRAIKYYEDSKKDFALSTRVTDGTVETLADLYDELQGKVLS